MRVGFMKEVDRWIGGIACITLDILDRPRRWLLPRPRVSDATRTILVTKYLGMGSIILAAPMVAALRRRFPKARIVFLTFESNRDLATILDTFDEILTIRAHRLLPMAWDTLAAVVRLWRIGIDIVCDLEFFARYSTMVAYLSGASVRVGFWSRIAWRGNLLTHPVYYNGMKHICRVFLAQAEVLGAEIDEEPTRWPLPRITPNSDAQKRLTETVRTAGLAPGRPFVLINPNASELCLERRWMPDRFASVIDSLMQDDESLQAVLIGTESERVYTQGVLDRCSAKQRVVNLAGAFSVSTLLEALRGASLMLTVDSGPLHMAAMMGTPTVALFGPETPSLYGGLGVHQKTFYAGVYCSPCLNVYNSKTAPCNGNNICMQAIRVDEVVDAARGLLRNGALTQKANSSGERRMPSLSS